MTCTNCGHRFESDGYLLRFAPEAREPKRLKLQLCPDCLDTLLDEPAIDLVSPPIVSTEVTVPPR